MNFVRVNGYPNYVIHPCGTILKIFKSHTKEKKTYKEPNGYRRVSLYNNDKKNSFYVHRLLALHFIKNDDPDNKIHIDHLDSVRDNNNLDNLEWVTQAENNRRRYLTNPAISAVITKGNIYKRKCGSWRWRYNMKGKQKSKTMKNREDLEKYREETTKNIMLLYNTLNEIG